MNNWTSKDCENETDWVEIVERDHNKEIQGLSIIERQEQFLDLQKFNIERLEKVIDRKNAAIEQLKKDSKRSKAKRDTIIKQLRQENLDLKMKQLHIDIQRSSLGGNTCKGSKNFRNCGEGRGPGMTAPSSSPKVEPHAATGVELEMVDVWVKKLEGKTCARPNIL
ncbi:hypothetical protein FB446DRAFT_704243 [Lentinula raphanica]|nr:hypothetical protein FB446DRAFT_704243 [Lentinula raphanica]